MSLTDVPLVVELFLLTPPLLLLARLGGYLGVALVRRVVPAKLAFNVAAFTLEAGVAVAIVQHVGGAGLLSLRGWGATYAAVLTGTVVLAVAVALAIALAQRPLTPRQFAWMLLPALLNGMLGATLGLLCVALVRVSGAYSVPLLLVGGVLVLAYRRLSRLVSEHKDLAQLYELTRQVSTALGGPGLDAAVLGRIRSLMRAELAVCWITADGETGAESVVSGEDGAATLPEPLDGPDAVRRRVLSGESLLVGRRGRDSELRADLATRGVTELVAVPLRVGGQVVGSLEVLDRQGERSHFGPADRTLLQTLAVHAGVALENARLVARLRHDAEHDPLTGLPNRRAFLDRVDAAVAAAPPAVHSAPNRAGPARGRGLVAVLCLDLQSFKDVNDTLGRAAGDQLLVEVAHRLARAAPEPRCAARLSSDELAVLVHVADLPAARAAAEALQATLATPVIVDGLDIGLGAVVGIAVHPEHGTDAVTLLQRADVAMYAAKRTSRGVLTYSPSMDAPSVRRIGLVAELRRALELEELVVWYQPQVRLDRSELVGLEALVRWQHPEHGLVPPDEFIPVAEHTGLIAPLTSFVLRRALRDLRIWRDAGHAFGMSVNISPRSLLDPGLVDEVGAELAAAGVPPSLLTLEITESGVMNDPDRAVPVLEALRDMGVRLSVDDFGIGHSSLTYLRRLPVAELKIDRSFVSSMVHDAGDRAIVRLVITLAAELDLSVVAEGVESEETRRELQALHCPTIQGYLLSRPLPRAGMDAWLTRRTVAEPSGAAGRPRRLRVVSGDRPTGEHPAALSSRPQPRVPCILSPCLAPIAQTAERLHGKEKVYGSIPYWGSTAALAGLVGGVAQMAEQAAHNRCVAGSSPATATNGRSDRSGPVGTLRAQYRYRLAREGTPWPANRCPPEDHVGLHGVQGAQLHHQEEPPQRPGPAGAREVLPALPLHRPHRETR